MSSNENTSLENFLNNLQRDESNHIILNMFDDTILHDSYLESNMRCSSPGLEHKPEIIRYVKSQNNWDGITVFTDKTIHLAPTVNSKVKVAWLIEPIDLLPQVYTIIQQYEEYFDIILTYEKSLLDKNPNKYKFHPCDTSGIERASQKLHEKNKLVSMVYSEKTWLFGHKLRHIVAKSLVPKIGFKDIDFFGRGTDNPVKLKSVTLNDYMFQIAIENAKRPNYFADKIYDCFVTGVVPIYWGAPNIGDFFDSRGILTFNNPDELTEILLNLNEEKYHSMFEYVKKNFETAKKYLRPDDLMYENIVKYLEEMVKNGEKIV